MCRSPPIPVQSNIFSVGAYKHLLLNLHSGLLTLALSFIVIPTELTKWAAEFKPGKGQWRFSLCPHSNGETIPQQIKRISLKPTPPGSN